MAGTENITVLFTDLVGSTELATSLSPDVADEVRRRHFSALRQTIAASGGTEVKNLGDGLMVVFPIASAALNCAVAMQQAVDRDNVGGERPLGIRVGLSAGEATKEEGDYFGDPVIEASRLCAKAASGQILVTGVVRANAGRRSTHAFTSLGELELKGLPDPIETLEVDWEPLAVEESIVDGVPLPARLEHRPGVGVIGREHELATLESAAKAVVSERGRQIILISGEPGQGKTTLVAEFARRRYESGATVLLGRCDEEIGAPYRPFSEALSHYVAHAPEPILRSHVRDHGGELSRMIPGLQKRLGDLPSLLNTDPDTERYLLYGAVVGLLESASSASPVVLVLDDLHWADKPSLQFLRHLIANTATTRLLIIATYRDAELSVAHPLTDALAALHREPAGVSSIELKGLDDNGVISFMESAAGHSLDEAGVGLAHQVYRETDGNPFFVSELLRELAESGVILQDSVTGRWSASDDERTLALPHSVRTVIGTRVSRLGEEATKVLSVAAVIGREFDLDLLAETTKVDEDALIDLMEEAHRAAIVTEVWDTPGRYAFSHALVQHTLYEDLGGTRRTRLHRVVGEAIEDRYSASSADKVGELARHFLLATRPADAEKAISYARQAGDIALAALAPDEAVRYFSQALDLAAQMGNGDASLRTQLLIGLGSAQRQAGIAEFRGTLFDAALAAQQLGDTDRLVIAALANNRGFYSSLGAIDSDRVEMLEAALAALPDEDSSSRALLLARLCNELTFGPLERRLELAHASEAMARRLADNFTLAAVICDFASALRIPAKADEMLDKLRAVFRIAGDSNDPNLQLQASVLAAMQGIVTADFDFARECFDNLTELADGLRHPAWLWAARFTAAGYALVNGDPSRAEELAQAALEIGLASGQPDAFSCYGTQLMEIRRQQGRMGELADLVAQVAEDHPGIPTYRAALASAYVEAGDAESAREILEAAAIHSFDLPIDTAWLDGIINYAHAVIELQMVDAAEQLLEQLRPYYRQVPFQGLLPHEPIAMFLGGLATVVDRFEEAESCFGHAAELNTRGEMKYAEAYTNMLWGRMLRTRNGPGDVDRARGLLEQARHSAVVHGYAAVEHRATVEMANLV